MPKKQPKPAKEPPEPTKTVLVPALHHNSKMTMEDAVAMTTGELKGMSMQEIGDESGVQRLTVRARFKGIEVPECYPETKEEWLSDVTKFMEIAVWKGSRRMAMTEMDMLDGHRLPISIAILTDKVSLLNGNPTSLAVVQHQTVNHSDVLSRMKQARAASTAIDSK